MHWQTTPYVFLLFFTSLTALASGLYAVAAVGRGDRTPTVRTFIALCAAGSLWAGTYAVQIAAPTLDAKIAAYGALHLGAAFVGPIWLAFALSYTGRSSYLTRTTVPALLAVPVALLVAFPTNPASLVLTDVSLVTSGSTAFLATGSGPLYQLNLAYTYLLVIGGAALVIGESIQSGGRVRRQAGLMAAGAVVPLALSFLHLFSLGPFGAVGEVNLTPVSLVVSTVFFGVAVFRYRLLDLTPIASRVVLTQIGDGVVVLDTDGSIVDVNPATERFLGGRDALIGTPLSDHVPEYAGLDVAGSTLVTVEADGEEAHLQLTRSPLDRDGTQYGHAVLLRDVTELERQRRELERKNERLDSFASVVSHDLRNPLAVIDGYADLARDTGDPAHIDVIQDTAAQMQEFLEELLQLSQRGDTVTDLQPVSLTAVAEDVGDAIADPDLTVAVANDVRLTADRARLRQVLDNLCRNACDHVDGAVSLTIGPCADGFYVEDDGPGISPADRDQVFDVGYTTREEGTGLGLSIVRDIVEAHGWSIAVAEGTGDGARFEVTGVETRDVAEPGADVETELDICSVPVDQQATD
ncbi:histidine kinase N-terminal 7TM domain-containing protein [Halorubrum sp. PV6]|uniref:histidine kinase N-terminal 7TM domain-containing protein n=1 Tax=Halorubrum sp. PV6 TaxID=634157 RepID=UPI000F855365|nr:histidine kinase N-terminal 7TM domain-containing protein [Halorubrum sp. PV6]AZQ13776.1 hypothetical protein DOS48_02475 [Halorubrum sp. PV6]